MKEQTFENKIKKNIIKVYKKAGFEACIKENGSYEPISTAAWHMLNGTKVQYDPSDKMCRIRFVKSKEVFYMGHMGSSETSDGNSLPIAVVKADGSFGTYGDYDPLQIELIKCAIDNNIPLFGWAYSDVNVELMSAIIEGIYLNKTATYIPTNFEVYKLVNSKLADDCVRLKYAMRALNNNVSIVDCLENAITYDTNTFQMIAIAAERGVNICRAVAKGITSTEIKKLFDLIEKNPEKARKYVRGISN